MSMRSRSKANIPIHRESLFWILSPVFCLLPNQPVLPSLPKIHESIMQNKPNSLNTEFNATLFATKLYRKNRPDRARKNKPNQTQFTRNTRYAMRHTNRESVEPAKMALKIDIFKTQIRRLEMPKLLNHKALNDFGSVLRPTGTPFAHKFATKPPRHKETIMQKCRNSSCPRLGPLGLRAFVAKKLKRKEFYYG